MTQQNQQRTVSPDDGSRSVAVSGGAKALMWGLIFVLVVVLAIVFTLRWWFSDSYVIPSESMEPGLQVGERIWIDPDYYEHHPIERGDVVVIDAQGSFTPYQPEQPFQDVLESVGAWIGIAPSRDNVVKRVIGISGDRVTCCTANGRIEINGHQLHEEHYLAEPDRPASSTAFDVTVPEDRVFLLGDNRESSLDSRDLLGAPGGGMVHNERVLAPVRTSRE